MLTGFLLDDDGFLNWNHDYSNCLSTWRWLLLPSFSVSYNLVKFRFLIFLRNGPFPASLFLISPLQQLTANLFIVKFWWWMDLKNGPLVSEATTLPTERQSLPNVFSSYLRIEVLPCSVFFYPLTRIDLGLTPTNLSSSYIKAFRSKLNQKFLNAPSPTHRFTKCFVILTRL